MAGFGMSALLFGGLLSTHEDRSKLFDDGTEETIKAKPRTTNIDNIDFPEGMETHHAIDDELLDDELRRLKRTRSQSVPLPDPPKLDGGREDVLDRVRTSDTLGAIETVETTNRSEWARRGVNELKRTKSAGGVSGKPLQLSEKKKTEWEEFSRSFDGSAALSFLSKAGGEASGRSDGHEPSNEESGAVLQKDDAATLRESPRETVRGDTEATEDKDGVATSATFEPDSIQMIPFPEIPDTSSESGSSDSEDPFPTVDEMIEMWDTLKENYSEAHENFLSLCRRFNGDCMSYEDQLAVVRQWRLSVAEAWRSAEAMAISKTDDDLRDITQTISAQLSIQQDSVAHVEDSERACELATSIFKPPPPLPLSEEMPALKDELYYSELKTAGLPPAGSSSGFLDVQADRASQVLDKASKEAEASGENLFAAAVALKEAIAAASKAVGDGLDQVGGVTWKLRSLASDAADAHNVPTERRPSGSSVRRRGSSEDNPPGAVLDSLGGDAAKAKTFQEELLGIEEASAAQLGASIGQADDVLALGRKTKKHLEGTVSSERVVSELTAEMMGSLVFVVGECKGVETVQRADGTSLDMVKLFPLGVEEPVLVHLGGSSLPRPRAVPDSLKHMTKGVSPSAAATPKHLILGSVKRLVREDGVHTLNYLKFESAVGF
eukprot:Rmarinus@m.27354